MREERRAKFTSRKGVMESFFDKADQNIIRDKVEKTSEKLKAGKIAGFDEVTVEYLRPGGNA